MTVLYTYQLLYNIQLPLVNFPVVSGGFALLAGSGATLAGLGGAGGAAGVGAVLGVGGVVTGIMPLIAAGLLFGKRHFI